MDSLSSLQTPLHSKNVVLDENGKVVVHRSDYVSFVRAFLPFPETPDSERTSEERQAARIRKERAARLSGSTTSLQGGTVGPLRPVVQTAPVVPPETSNPFTHWNSIGENISYTNPRPAPAPGFWNQSGPFLGFLPPFPSTPLEEREVETPPRGRYQHSVPSYQVAHAQASVQYQTHYPPPPLYVSPYGNQMVLVSPTRLPDGQIAYVTAPPPAPHRAVTAPSHHNPPQIPARRLAPPPPPQDWEIPSEVEQAPSLPDDRPLDSPFPVELGLTEDERSPGHKNWDRTRSNDGRSLDLPPLNTTSQDRRLNDLSSLDRSYSSRRDDSVDRRYRRSLTGYSADGLKRGRGRPRKDFHHRSDSYSLSRTDSSVPMKRGPGRPRGTTKRGPGRPRKIQGIAVPSSSTFPSERRKTVVYFDEDVLPRKHRSRIPTLPFYEGKRLLYDSDNNLVGCEGFVDGQHPQLLIPANKKKRRHSFETSSVYSSNTEAIAEQMPQLPDLADSPIRRGKGRPRIHPPKPVYPGERRKPGRPKRPSDVLPVDTQVELVAQDEAEDLMELVKGGVRATLLSRESTRIWREAQTQVEGAGTVMASISMRTKRFMVAEVILKPLSRKESESVLPGGAMDLTILECDEGEPLELTFNRDSEPERVVRFGKGAFIGVHSRMSYSIFNSSRKRDAKFLIVLGFSQGNPASDAYLV